LIGFQNGELFGSTILVYQGNLFIGAPYNDNKGCVYVYVGGDNKWTFKEKWVGDEGLFGASITINING
jgi:hypothetical protein